MPRGGDSPVAGRASDNTSQVSAVVAGVDNGVVTAARVEGRLRAGSAAGRGCPTLQKHPMTSNRAAGWRMYT